MTKPMRRSSWLRTSLRNVIMNARTSVVVTVALLPSLITQVFAYFNHVTPVQWIIGLLVTMGAVFTLFLYLEARAVPRDASGFIRGTLDPGQIRRIHGLVTVVSNMQKPGTRAAQTLIQGLPNLEVVHCITCDGDDGAHEVQLLREWIVQQGRRLDVRALDTTPDRLRFDESSAQRLGDELQFVHDPDRLIIDITADSQLMGLTLYLAAAQRRLPITYVPSAREGYPGEKFALSVIRDPQGLFSEDSADTAGA